MQRPAGFFVRLTVPIAGTYPLRVICPACGVENRPGRRFCGKCGTALAVACPSCGAANGADESYCGDCGAKLAADAVDRQQSGISRHASERRHVSVLFADLVGFTSLSEQRDAEDVRELLSEYFDTARTVIGRYGGSIEKFIGDAVMAVWGVPVAQEDDAERAVRAALDLVDAVGAFGETSGVPGLRARAGVLTGEAAVNLDASGEGMVAGDMVNTASRVQTAASPGTVLVGEATWRATEASIRYQDAGLHELKGKPEPLRLWRAAGVIAARGGALRRSGLEPPFVGRDRELRILKELLHATSEEGKARLLSIVGVAGVGKSRLAWEFEKYVDGLTEGIWWHRGRCLSYGEGVAYSALAEMVRMRAGIAENETSESAREKLRICVESFLPDTEERLWTEPRLAQLLGLEELASSDPHDLYSAWRVFFERLAGEGLTVLLFGDLQWADPGLLDFIDYLLDWSRTSPILVLTLSRPELAERRPSWGGGKRAFTSLQLEPLSAEAITKLLDGLVPGLPHDLVTRIRDRAAGIPLYAVETVRMLLDRGLVVEHGGVYRAEGSLDELEVPESLHALIAARLDSLSAEDRRLVQDAAVLGKAFTPAALAAITGLAQDGIEPRLRALVHKDLLAVQSDPRSPERGQYVFVQDLVRAVAYGTLARRERRQRHVAVADFLTSSWSDEDDVAEVIASHLVEAYESDPSAPDAAAIGERARAALVRAAEHASALGGPESACRYYERALELPGIDGRAALHRSAGRAASLLGQGERASAHFDRAIQLFGEAGQTVAQADSLHDLSLVDATAGDRHAALAHCEQALALLRPLPADDASVAVMAMVEARLGRNLFFLERHDEALVYSDRALLVADERRIWPVLALGLDTKGAILFRRGQLFEAETLVRAALRVALDHGLPDANYNATTLATMLEDSDEAEASIEMYEQSAELLRRRGDRRQMVGARLNQIANLLELGRWDEVDAIATDYFDVEAPEFGARWEFGFLVASAIWLYLRRGDLAAARRLHDGYLVLPDGARNDLRTMVINARAAMLNAESDHGQALQVAEATLRESFGGLLVDTRASLIEAVDAAFSLGRNDKVEELIALVRGRIHVSRVPSLEAHVLRWEGRVSAGAGAVDDGDAKFAAAVMRFVAMRRPFWAAVTRLEYARALVAQDRDSEAEGLVRQARAAFAELRAAPWLQQADALAGEISALRANVISA
jgi:class 3 adenylate cyclase/tetratricopeptide (TPR) repeat protein